MTDFERALDLLAHIEGGFSNRSLSDDPGGRTKYGISERSHPAAWCDGAPTKAASAEIFLHDYWQPAGCDNLPWPISYWTFDFAVNSGAPRAVRSLQAALGVSVDGVVGPKTCAAAQRITEDRDRLALFLADRAVFMSRLHNWQPNRRGWMKRLFLLAFDAKP